MGFFYWGEKNKPSSGGRRNSTYDRHEQAHARACRGEGLSYRWVDRRGQPVVEASFGMSKNEVYKAAVALYAGYLAGGGDDKGDRKAAEELAREAGVSIEQVEKQARKYL